jgi:pyridoxamine 5'-phosphate oxidase
MIDIAALRRSYTHQTLDDTSVLPDPIAQFGVWFGEAVAANVLEPNAMSLATVSADARPSVRTVLLKGYDAAGFTFFTNFESRKGHDLAAHPHAALLFTWLDLERQIRIEGHVQKLAAAEAEAYFHSRPKGSQIGAWASPQSRRIPDRSVLETAVRTLETEYAHADRLPLPPFWGGYRVVPDLLEFWQGRPNRLHDRLQYTRRDDTWDLVRLAP